MRDNNYLYLELEEAHLNLKTKMSSSNKQEEEEVLAPLSPTSVSQMTNNFLMDEQLKGIVSPVEDDDQDEKACLCNEAVKENVSVSFDYENSQAFLSGEAAKEISPQGSFDGEIDHILVPKKRKSALRGSITKDGAAICKTGKKLSVSFAPLCQAIQLVDDNQTEGLEQMIDHILGLKERSVFQGIKDDAAIRKTSKKRSVRFAPSLCQVIQLDNLTEGHEHEIWYSRYDFLVFQDEAVRCCQMIQHCESQGTFDGEIDHILGLEKIILCDCYTDRREALRKAIMDEQAVQQMVNEIRARQVRESDDSTHTTFNAEDINLMKLAKTSERLSVWARDRAFMCAFTLEHDLAPEQLKMDHSKEVTSTYWSDTVVI